MGVLFYTVVAALAVVATTRLVADWESGALRDSVFAVILLIFSFTFVLAVVSGFRAWRTHWRSS